MPRFLVLIYGDEQRWATAEQRLERRERPPWSIVELEDAGLDDEVA